MQGVSQPTAWARTSKHGTISQTVVFNVSGKCIRRKWGGWEGESLVFMYIQTSYVVEGCGPLTWMFSLVSKAMITSAGVPGSIPGCESEEVSSLTDSIHYI